MRCHACDIALDTGDNYCRRCGAPVRVVELVTTTGHRDVVTVGPSAPALLAVAARPIAAGAVTVAAGALVRYALRRAVRGRSAAPARALSRSTPPPSTTTVTEVFWYRRVSRG